MKAISTKCVVGWLCKGKEGSRSSKVEKTSQMGSLELELIP